VTIEPDTKDWTWVLRQQCPDCGFDPSSVTAANVGARIRHAAAAMQARLRGADVGTRPNEQTWSPLEDGAHVRDVCRVMTQRLRLLLDEDEPEFANWDQDQAALDGDYASQNPEQVVAELDLDASAFARAAETVPDGARSRRGRRSNGSVFTVETLLVYALHDLEHHVHDVGA